MKKRSRWGVVPWKPSKMHRDYAKSHNETIIRADGMWCITWLRTAATSRPKLFNTRAEARLSAKESERLNKWWKFHAKKYSA